MTVSVSAARKFVGDAPVSVRAWAQLEQRTPPIKLRELATVERRDANGQVSAGDVECSYQATFWNSGRWFLTTDFRDDGALFGDYFTLWLEIAGQDRGMCVDHHEQPLGPGDTLRVNDNGLDPWIRDNWPAVRDGRIAAHLSASPDVAGIIEAATGLIVLIGVITYLASPGNNGVRPCPNQDGFDHNQCLEFYKAQGEPPTSGVTEETG